MFEFSLRSGSSRPKPVTATACLRLERLEDRIVASTTPTSPPSTVGPATPVSSAPVIDSYYVAQYLPNRQVVLAGHVTDPYPGCTVNFTGVATGMANCDSSGSFQITLTASAIGQIQAIAHDTMGTASAAATVTLTNSPPVISNFTATQGSGGMWTFSGKVTDEAPSGLTVVLSSAMPSLRSVSTTVRSDGTFSVCVQLGAGEQGTVAADCTDWWGAAATTVYTTVRPV